MNERLNIIDTAITVQSRLRALLAKFNLQRVLLERGDIRVKRVEALESGSVLQFEVDVQLDGVPHTIIAPIGMAADGCIHANFDALAAFMFAEIGRFLARVPELVQERRRLRVQVEQAIALAAEHGLDLELLAISWTKFDLSGRLGWEVAIARFGRSKDEILHGVFHHRVDSGDIDRFAADFANGELQEQLHLSQRLGPVKVVDMDR